jgi:type II secretory pathway pseudopilin PulG
VVIGIIAVLMSLLLPALGRARAQARDVKCLANLRSIGQGLAIYANQNRNVWPRPGRPLVTPIEWWHKTWIFPIVQNRIPSASELTNNTYIADTVFECPSARDVWRTTDMIDISYAMSARLNDEVGSGDDDSGRGNFKRISKIKGSAQTAVIFDSEGPWGGTLTGANPAGWQSQRFRLQKGSLRHNKHVNFLFADYHAERLNYEKQVPKDRTRTEWWQFWCGSR